MTVYIEYAFLQNFLLDGILLRLAFSAARRQLAVGRWLCSAAIGAAFAVLFPLLVLPTWAATALRFSVGALLCLLPFGRCVGRRARRQFALVCALFYGCTFALGGALYSVTDGADGWTVTLLAAAFAILFDVLLRVVYRKRETHRFIYPCEVVRGTRRVRLSGYLDSGNRLTKDGLPVCFLTPDVFYDLFQTEFLTKGEGQVCDEIRFQTLSGETRSVAARAELIVRRTDGKSKRTSAYFAPSANMLRREYALLLNGALIDQDGG